MCVWSMLKFSEKICEGLLCAPRVRLDLHTVRHLTILFVRVPNCHCLCSTTIHINVIFNLKKAIFKADVFGHMEFLDP